MKVRAKPAKKKHHARIAEMMRDVWARPDTGALTQAEAEARLTLLLGGGYRPVLCQKGDAICGYALVQENGDHLFIRHFAVVEDARRKGVGTAFFRALASEYGWPEIRLDVMAGRDEARAFWETLGFAAAGVNMRRGAQEET